MTNLTISYNLAPPATFDITQAPSSPSAVLSYPIGTDSPNEQLAAIQLALGEAREKMNEVLTEWKLAVGPLEPGNKGSRKKNPEEEEEEEE